VTTAAELFPARDYFDEQFVGVEADGGEVVGVRFDHCTFEKATLPRARFVDCVFQGCTIRTSDLNLAAFPGTRLSDVAFEDTKLTGSVWREIASTGVGAARGLRFARCLLDFAAMSEVRLRNARFEDCSLREADLAQSDFGDAAFVRCELAGVRFQHTRLARASLVGSRNYVIDPRQNDIAGLRVSLPDGLGLLHGLGIVIEDERSA
jgi:uncharacterized protein YjbI with pentapeptide repeats